MENNEPIDVDRAMGRKTRRAFLTALLAGGAGYGGWRWLMSRPQAGGIPWPFRKVLQFNQALTSPLVSADRRIRQAPISKILVRGPRLNGDIGIDSPIDVKKWRLRVQGMDRQLVLGDLYVLPQITQVIPLNCIEGWTTYGRWTGVRFSDFVDRFYPAGRDKPYVGMETPDGEYFVGLDAASAFHPQTLLCYAIDNELLSEEHGAPLRLLIPVKYGIKNLKRIGAIRFADQPPKDFWAQEGYDWFAGL